MFYLPLPVGTRITQRFGERAACVSTDGRKKVISCDGNNPPKGFKSIYGPRGHKGIDFAAFHGQEVYCSRGGVVDSIDTDTRTGLDVRVVSDVDGVKYRHIYEHLLGYQPKKGDIIPTGSLIGWADNTGYSSASHLHFQLERWDNGTWKAVDPEPLLLDQHAKNAMFKEDKISYSLEQLSMAVYKLSKSLRNLIIYLNKGKSSRGGTS